MRHNSSPCSIRMRPWLSVTPVQTAAARCCDGVRVVLYRDNADLSSAASCTVG